MSAVCDTCSTSFEPDPAHAKAYPGWTPKQCTACFRGTKRSSGGGRPSGRRRPAVEENLTVAQVLEKYTAGPTTGVFTDGSATPNPGPGGWGAVYVVDDEIIDQQHGEHPDTTNNRMELEAIRAAYGMVPAGTNAVIHTDSKLAVDTLTTWAHGWQAKGWKRKGGPIANLDLVQPIFDLVQARPEITLQWIKAHSGNRWNEYADSLSTAYSRDVI